MKYYLIVACYSGTMISHLVGDNRILITAADSKHEAYTMATFPLEEPYTHWAFLYRGRNWMLDNSHPGFILTMGDMNSPQNVLYAYQHGEDATYNNKGLPDSYPEIEWYDINPEDVYW